MNDAKKSGPAQPTSREAASVNPVEAEQNLLGTLMLNNDVYDRIEAIVKDRHFCDPLHRRIFEVITSLIIKGKLASPVSLKPYLETDPGLTEVGGIGYIARLAGASVSVFAAEAYAKIIFDAATRRELNTIGGNIQFKALTVEVDEETQDQIIDAEQQLYALSVHSRTGKGYEPFAKTTLKTVEAANAAYHQGDKLTGISTGFRDLDAKLNGLHKSDLIILAGRPSMGKTALATNIAYQIAKTYKKGTLPDGTEGAVAGGIVGFASLEMATDQVGSRIFSDAANINSHHIRSGDLPETDFRKFVETAMENKDIPLHIDETPALPISQIAARARRLKRTHGLDVLIVDYLQLVRAVIAKNNRVNEVAEVTTGLKALAKELNIPVLALSQLSRQVETRPDKRPQMADLRESGSIEQDADCVMFIYREEYYKEREKPGEYEVEKMANWEAEMAALAGKAEIIISKHRHGPTGSVELHFDGRYTRFSDPATQRHGSSRDDEI